MSVSSGECRIMMSFDEYKNTCSMIATIVVTFVAIACFFNGVVAFIVPTCPCPVAVEESYE